MQHRLADDRWLALSPHLDEALDLPDEQRAAWLKGLRARDATLAAELEVLLERHTVLSHAGFLEGAPPPLPREGSLAGHRIGAYALRQQIGQGGMGSVWLADRADGRFEGVAAVKLLNASLVGRDGEARFQREGNILARLRHPNIAQLIDAGVSPLGHPYLVLEHVAGQAIDTYCDERRLGVEARLRLFLDVLAAVAHAHANLIVHRDIKPSNVMVDAQGRVKLLDFGIAKLIEVDDGITREGEAALTPEYAAPEQLTGEPVTTATDVYALGVVLYVLLTGRHPVSRGRTSPAELVRAIVDTVPARASDVVMQTVVITGPDAQADAAGRRATTVTRLRSQLRGDLDNILAKALKKAPAERYGSAEAMAEDVRRHLTHKPVTARADSLRYRAAKFARRNAAAVTAGAATVVLLAALVSFYTYRLSTERDHARREAGKTRKMSELLAGLFTVADPYTDQAKKSPTVLDVLAAGTKQVDEELGSEPELQVEMLTVLGRVYQRLGENDRALPLLERAVAIGRQQRWQNALLAQSLNDLGALLDAKGDYEAARARLDEAVQLRRQVLGPEHPDLAVSMVELGRVYTELNRLDEAERLFVEALAMRRKVLDDKDNAIATSLSDLALLRRRKGDLAGAEELMRENLQRTGAAFGPDHADLGTAHGNLGLILGDLGRLAEAEGMLREAVRISRAALGPAHADSAYKLSNLAHVLRQANRHDEAITASLEGLAVARPALGPRHSLVARLEMGLGLSYLALGRAREAEPILRSAAATLEAAFGREDWRAAAVRSALGEALMAEGRHAEAEPLLIDAGRLLKPGAGSQGREAQANAQRLAALRQGRAQRRDR